MQQIPFQLSPFLLEVPVLIPVGSSNHSNFHPFSCTSLDFESYNSEGNSSWKKLFRSSFCVSMAISLVTASWYCLSVAVNFSLVTRLAGFLECMSPKTLSALWTTSFGTPANRQTGGPYLKLQFRVTWYQCDSVTCR